MADINNEAVNVAGLKAVYDNLLENTQHLCQISEHNGNKNNVLYVNSKNNHQLSNIEILKLVKGEEGKNIDISLDNSNTNKFIYNKDVVTFDNGATTRYTEDINERMYDGCCLSKYINFNNDYIENITCNRKINDIEIKILSDTKVIGNTSISEAQSVSLSRENNILRHIDTIEMCSNSYIVFNRNIELNSFNDYTIAFYIIPKSSRGSIFESNDKNQYFRIIDDRLYIKISSIDAEIQLIQNQIYHIMIINDTEKKLCRCFVNYNLHGESPIVDENIFTANSFNKGLYPGATCEICDFTIVNKNIVATDSILETGMSNDQFYEAINNFYLYPVYNIFKAYQKCDSETYCYNNMYYVDENGLFIGSSYPFSYDNHNVEWLGGVDATIEDLKQLNGTRIFHYYNYFEKPPCYTLHFNPKKQIILPSHTLTDCNMIKNILSVTIEEEKKEVTSSSYAKYAFTTNLEEYKIYNKLAKEWQNINIDDLSEKGMSAADISSLTKTEYELLFDNCSNKDFSIAMLIFNESNDRKIYIKNISITINEKDIYRKAIHITDYDYGYIEDNLAQIQFFTKGLYKINYSDQ